MISSRSKTKLSVTSVKIAEYDQIDQEDCSPQKKPKSFIMISLNIFID